MKWRINKFEITNFKFFKETFCLNVDGKHLLMYGENGSGKSSIYWAFYTMFQSCFKKPTDTEAQKYFIEKNTENLRNKFSNPDAPSSLKLELISESKVTKTYEDSNSICNTHVDGDNLMTLSAASSDFWNYKFLSVLLDFKNSEENDIFSIVETDLLPAMFCSTDFSALYVTSQEEKPLSYWWRTINTRCLTLPRNKRQISQFNQGCQEYRDFKKLVEDFNKELAFQLKTLQEEVNKKLKNQFKIPVEISLRATSIEFNKRRAGTKRGYDGIVHRPKVIISAIMTNAALNGSKKLIVHPKSFFNEAKLTCIALALRLAVVEMKYNGGDSVAALFIDDLLISLDMGRRLQVVDIILNLQKKYQLFIFTHDRAFYEIISSKIESLGTAAEQQWVQKKIFAQDEKLCIDGIPAPFMLDKEDWIESAKHYMYNCDLPACANYLRKAAEHEFKRLYPSCWLETGKYEKDIQHTERAELNNMILRFSDYCERYSMKNKLHNMGIHRKRLLNPFSHDDLHTPIYRLELQDCMDEISWLRSIERIKDVYTEEEILYNRYCIRWNNKGRFINIVFKFEEVFDHIKVEEIENDKTVIKTYHSNSIIKVLYCSCPQILNDDPNTDFHINGLPELALQFLGYKNNDPKPSFDELVRPYTKEMQIADMIDAVLQKKV